MDKNKVMHTFCTYSGLTLAECAEFEQLITLSMIEAGTMLRADAIVEDDTLICYLAGVFAFYKYAVIKSADTADEVKLGEVTVKNGGGKLIEAATIARNDAIILCHEILEDSFFFSGTPC